MFDKLFKSAILLVFITTPFISNGQKRTTIKDPEVEFSLETPKKWQKQDDELNLYLIPPGSNGIEYLSLTYSEADTASISYLFKAAIERFYPLNEPNYKLLETGDDTVGTSPAKWATFESKLNGVEYKSLYYIFEQSGQIFKVRGTATKANFEDFEKGYTSIIKSVESRRL